jgi:ppGpp synthetase/RelA/SpoT-type nucleotidyltranferase
MSEDIEKVYRQRYERTLKSVATRLRDHIADQLKGTPHIDRIDARAKTPERFLRKAEAKLSEDEMKYSAPLEQIQDQLGARIVVFYPADVDVVSQHIDEYFTHIEKRDIVPDSQWAFGYFGRHWILALPRDVIPEDVEEADVPRFFELQVKTLFQHAWSEASHDLAYKPAEDLTVEQQRMFAYTSAQAWGADQVFEGLREELVGGLGESTG